MVGCAEKRKSFIYLFIFFMSLFENADLRFLQNAYFLTLFDSGNYHNVKKCYIRTIKKPYGNQCLKMVFFLTISLLSAHHTCLK